MEVLEFLKEYWVLITFFLGEIGVLYGAVRIIYKGIRCCLRNDILDIFDRCKGTQQITRYQLQSIKFSYDVYKKLKGNSFVEDIVEKVNDYEVID